MGGYKSPYLQNNAVPIPVEYKHQRKDTGPLPSLNVKELEERPDSPIRPRPSSVVDFKEITLSRLRFMLKDRESCIIKLKSEMMVLKQIERRQQRDLDNFEDQNDDDFPKIIQGLRDEISKLKQKGKLYFAQISIDERQIRQLISENNSLKENVEKLETLISKTQLVDRDFLQKEVTELKEQLKLNDSIKEDAVKKADMLERNLSSDNKHLRLRVHNLEIENALFKEKVSEKEGIINERDNEIMTLAIYRYNAIHKKAEAGCKTCLQREKAEAELRRKELIKNKLPKLPAPSVTVLTGTSALVSFSLPPRKSDDQKIEFSKLWLVCSTIGETPITKKLSIEFGEPLIKAIEKKTVRGKKETKIETKKAAAEKSILYSQFDAETKLNSVKVNGLECGKLTSFSLIAGHLDVEGNEYESKKIIIDLVPQKIEHPTFSVERSPPTIMVHFKAPESNSGSLPYCYKILYSNQDQFSEEFLAGEYSPDNLKETSFTFSFAQPFINIPYYFKIAAVNHGGVGAFSNISEMVKLDLPPNKPSKPIIKKRPDSSVQIKTNSEPHNGSAVKAYRILGYKIDFTSLMNTNNESQANNNQDSVTTEIDIIVPVDWKRNYELFYTLGNLIAHQTYRFQVQAINDCGTSIESEPSDEVTFDHVLPIPAKPIVQIVSGTSVILKLPDTSEYKLGILGFNLIYSDSIESLHDSEKYVGVEEKSVVIDRLVPGGIYYFAICLVNEKEEGCFSLPTVAILASAFTLPESPPGTPDMSKEMHPLSKAGSKGTSLSRSQRLDNLHNGQPAHAGIYPDTGARISFTNLAGRKKSTETLSMSKGDINSIRSNVEGQPKSDTKIVRRGSLVKEILKEKPKSHGKSK